MRSRLLAFAFLATLLLSRPMTAQFRIAYDSALPQAAFAADEIEAALADRSEPSFAVRLEIDRGLGDQAYKLAEGETGWIVSGGDARGVMYGGLELAEQIRVTPDLADIEAKEASPFIARRGLKFNIPLDIRTPSYQDAGDAAQNNIAEMWNFQFWREYLDAMARNHYNVLTLWNPHPFPSMIRLDAYPDAALDDVCGTSLPLDTDRIDEPLATFIAGCGISQPVLDNLIVLKRMTIEQKIDFWRRVMRHARDRGIDVYFVTWNIWMNSLAPAGWYRQQATKVGDAGKYGINNDQENPRTVAYLRACVREFIRTYPDLSGIGLTPGENMEDRDDEYDREKWLWATYGEGVMDAKKLQPDREIGMIHRVWQSGMQKIMTDFVPRYPDEINLSFKYARARLYATPAPKWSAEYVTEIRGLGMKSWWNLRNDDIFHFRWGDSEYVREFMKNIPPPDVTAGYYMGSDGYVWGREFISLHPNHPRDLEVEKHWFSFLLWGRLGYDPNLSVPRIVALLGARYPEIEADALHAAWTASSRIIPLVNRFHWKNWDFMWAVEGCLDLRKGFHTVEDFIETPTMEGSGLLSIPDYVALRSVDSQIQGTTPLEVANQLDGYADDALTFVGSVRVPGLVLSKELSELLYDIEAMSFLGRYYADKIRGGVALHLFSVTGATDHKQSAIELLESALIDWRAYAGAATSNYRPQFMAKTRTIDWLRLTDDVRGDIEIAQQAEAN